MKKKNLALTKRVVSFITAACLSISSTIMVLPASAYTGDSVPESATVGGECLTDECTGKYAWAADDNGNHVLKCNAESDQHTADSTFHKAGAKSDEECTLCAEMPDVTINNISSPDGFSIKVTCDDADVASASKIAKNSTLTLAINGENADNYAVVWNITGGAEEGNLTASTSEEGVTTVSNVVSDIAIGATLTEKEASSETTTYKVNYSLPSDTTKGTFTVTKGEGETVTNDSSVDENTEITIKPAPVTGYEVEKVTVNEKDVTADEDGAYKYTVTADVAITVTFKAIEYTVTVTQPEKGTISVKNGENDVTSDTKVTVEDTLTLKANDDVSSSFSKWVLTNATIQGDGTETSSEITVKPNGAGNVVISAEYVDMSPGAQSYDITGYTDGNGNKVEANSTTAYPNDTITLTVTAVEGYELVANSVKVYYTDNTSSEVDVTAGENGQYTFIMPYGAVTITAEFKAASTPAPDTYTVTIAEAENGTVAVTYGDENTPVVSGATALEEGTKVTITPTPSNNYEVDTVKYNSTDATKNEDGTYSFTMPTEAVTITVTFKETAPVAENHKVTINTVNGNGDGTTVATAYTGDNGNGAYDSETGVAKDTKVTVKITNTSTDKEIESVTYKYNDGEATPITADDNGNYVFTMPDYDVTVTVTFKAKEVQPSTHSVTVDSALANGEIKATSDSSFTNVEKGTTVKFTATPADNYTLKKGTLKVMNGEEEVTVTTTYKTPGNEYSGVDYYSFSMPDADVTVTATFIAKVNWVANEDGSYTITSTDNGYYGEGYVDLNIKIADLLEAKTGVELSDVVSFSMDYAWDTFNEGYNGKVGVNCDEWKETAAFNEASGTVTITVDGKASAENLLVQLHYAGINSKLTISNIKANTETHNITVDDKIENGKVVAPETAQYGDTVTLTVTPDANYKLKGVTVTYTESETAGPRPVTVTDNKFVMPNADVTVTAEFEEIGSIFTVTIGDEASKDKLDDWAAVTDYIKKNGAKDKDVIVTVNGDGTFKGSFPTAQQAKSLTINGSGTLTFDKSVKTINFVTDTTINVKVASVNKIAVNAKGTALTFGANYSGDIISNLTGTNKTALTVADDVKLTVAQLKTFANVKGDVTVNGNVAAIAKFDGTLTVNGTKSTTVAITEVAKNAVINLVQGSETKNKVTTTFVPKLTITSVEASASDDVNTITINVVDADGKLVDLESGTIVAYSAKDDISDNIKIGNKNGEKALTAFFYKKTKAIKAEYAGAMTLGYNKDVDGKPTPVSKDYPNLELALEAMTENTGYMLTINEDVTIPSTFAMPKNINSLNIAAKEESGAKLIFAGTKLNVTKSLYLDLPVEVPVTKTNKTGKIDVTVSANQAFALGNDYTGNVINKVTGNKTAIFMVGAENITVGQIATFDSVYANKNLTVNGNVSAVTNFYGYMTVSGAKSKIAITNVLGQSTINLVQDGTAIPALTISDIKDITDQEDETGELSLYVVKDGAAVPLTSGTTVATIKAVKGGSTADVVNSKIRICNVDNKNNQLSAIYYTKGNAVKAEYKDAITLIYGAASESNKGTNLPNLEKVLEDINTKNNPNLASATDVTITINSDVTAATNFALPKNNNIKSLTFNGEGSITFTGTKLTVTNDTTFDVAVIADNKAKAIDVTVSSSKTKAIELTITENVLVDDGVSYFGKLAGNTGATLTVDVTWSENPDGYSYYNSVAFNGISKFDEVSGVIDVNGNVANVGVFSGILDVYGAKTTVGITTIKDYKALANVYPMNQVPESSELTTVERNISINSALYLNEASNVLPKVTLTEIEKDSKLNVGVYADEIDINLESGRTILYTKDKNFAGANQIVIQNNWENNEATMTAVFDASKKTIKAVDNTAINLQVYNSKTEKYEDIADNAGKFASFEDAVAYIEKAKNAEASYQINVLTSVEVAKFALPKVGTADYVVISCAEDAVINIGKTASITANTNVRLIDASFKFSGKALTLTAKNDVYLDGDTNITAFKGASGKAMYICGESENAYDVSGFGTVNVGDEVDSGVLNVNTTLNVNKLVLAEDSEVWVSGSLKNGTFKAFDAGKNAIIRYNEMGKNTLKFAGKAADFAVDADGLFIDGAEYGTKILSTKALTNLDKLFKVYGYDYANAAEDDVKPTFTQVGNDIVLLSEIFELSSDIKDATDVKYAQWTDVVNAINSYAKANKDAAKTANYTIKLRAEFPVTSAAALKFPNKGSYASLTIDGGYEITDNEGKHTYRYDFPFTGSLTLTGNTTFKDVNIYSVKYDTKEKVYDAVKYKLSASAFDVVFDNAYTYLATITAKNLTNKGYGIEAEKITVSDTFTTNLPEDDYFAAYRGITTKNWVLESDTEYQIATGSKITVKGELSSKTEAVADAEATTNKLNVVILDKAGEDVATTIAKNYSLGSVKKGAELVTLGNEGYEIAVNAKTGALTVNAKGGSGTVTPAPAKQIWTVTSDKIVFTAINGNTSDNNNQYANFAGAFPISGLLPSGKKLSDVKTVTCDIKFVNGWGGGCIGLNNGDTSKYEWGDWVQGNWENPADCSPTTATINLGGYGVGSSENITIDIWWAGADEGDAQIEFSNFKFNF